MKFFEKNRNFITHAFFVGMRNLSREEKLTRYDTFKYGSVSIKHEIRERISSFYNNDCKINNINEFYEELFEFFSEYESDFIFMNLLYENKAVDIINHLLISKKLNNIFLREENEIAISLHSSIALCHKSNKRYLYSDLKKILSSYFSKILNENNVLNKNDFSIIKLYSKWLVENITKNPFEAKQSFLCFVALWPFLKEKSISEKSIYFYHSLILELNNGKIEYWYDFILFQENYFKQLFVSIIHVPLINKESMVSFSPGYLAKKDELKKIFEKSKKYKDLHQMTNLINLLKTMNESDDSKIIFKIKSMIDGILLNKVISSENIQQMIDMNLNATASKIRFDVLRKQYRFEIYDIYSNLNQLDNNIVISKTRYSDQELLRFKVLIFEKIKKINSELYQLNNGIKKNIKIKSKTEIEDQKKNYKFWLQKYQDALDRIENKTYGICKLSGKLISKQRLLALPHVTNDISNG